MDLDKARVIEQRANGRDRGIVPLGVPDTEDGSRRGSGVEHLLRLAAISRERLLHQHGCAALEKRERHAEMRVGRHGNRHRVDPAQNSAAFVLHGALI